MKIDKKDKSSVSLNTSIQNINIPMSPKVNITINSNLNSPKAPTICKTVSMKKKTSQIANTSINGISPKSTIILDTFAFRSIDRVSVVENYILSKTEKEELSNIPEIFFLGKLQKVILVNDKERPQVKERE